MTPQIITTIWLRVKEHAISNRTKVCWVEICDRYCIYTEVRGFRLICEILKTDPKSDDQIDFEDNYKD
jgi:hypothetical protein